MGTFVENVNSLATNLTVDLIEDITTVSGSIGSVNTVATNILDINAVVDQVVPNLAEILLADDNATIATAQASIATTKATEAEASASSANTSAINASDSETVATAQAGIAITKAGEASASAISAGNSATSATAQALSASTSADNALISANNAALSESAALLSETNASASAVTATTQASISATKAGEANASAIAAALSETNAALLLDMFDDRYLGQKAVEPTVDNDGNALLVGALYFDTVLNRIRVWDGLLWSDALELTAGSTSVLTNKTIDDISNAVGADHVHYKVRNASGATIAKGTVVTAQGTQSGTDYIQVVPVTDPQTQIAIGIVHTTLHNNGTGLATNTGVTDDFVNTSAWSVGTVLYPNNSGGLTSTKPTSGIYQACAYVMRQHATQGTLLVEFTEPKDTTAKILADILASGIPIDLGGIV